MPKDEYVPHSPTNGPVAWAALVIAVLAMLVSGYIYFDNYNLRRQLTELTINTAEVTLTVANEAQLATIELANAIEATIPEEELVAAVQELRAEIAMAARTASVEVRQDLAALDAELEQIENQARQDAAAAANSLEMLGARLEQDLETDREGQPLN